MKNSTNYTVELNKILSYIDDVLINEFPTNTITTEYLITSILDNKKSHAYMILDSCLMSSNIEELKKIFLSFLRDKSNPIIDKNKIRIDIKLEDVINMSIHEKKSNISLIGSEHILMSLLNPLNKNDKMICIFKNIGIDYDFVYNKCNDNIKFTDLNNDNNRKKQNIMNNFPLKSEINPKSLINKTNFIQNFTIDINKTSNEGKVDDLIGRKEEVNKLIQVLSRRKKNNAVIVGKSGCGKTSLVLGLAKMIENGNVPDIMKNKKIVQLNVAALIAGTYLRGAFEERLKGLFDEMKVSPNYILFIDDIHTVLKSSSKEKDADITSMITDVLTDGDIRVIATTTFKDYRNSIEVNSMISRRLQKIVLNPTTRDETIEILNNNKHYYEDYHKVVYPYETIVKCVELSERYITDRSLPDSAIDIIDLCGAKTSLISRKTNEMIEIESEIENINLMKTNLMNSGDFEGVDNLLTKENELKIKLNDLEDVYNKNHSDEMILPISIDDVYKTISDYTNIPVSKLSVDEKKQLANINNVLKESVIGQDEAIDIICRSIKRNKIGLGNPNRVIFGGLLVGKSGCGKTLLAKKLAEEVYGDKNALVRIDMSEYSEKSSVSKLIGANAGYIGYDNGGILTESVKNKQHCVLLLDEIEKADKEVYNIFLQLLDEGHLTDNSGQLVNFKNVIVLMTSNVGTKRAQDLGNGIGFIEGNIEVNSKSIIEKEIKNRFTPEFLNRLDNIVYFNDLTKDNLKDISKLELNKVISRLNNLGYTISYNDDVIENIALCCQATIEQGARPIGRYIQNNIEDVITDMILTDDCKKNFFLNVDNDKIVIY